jgi:hypothetical protein
MTFLKNVVELKATGGGFVRWEPKYLTLRSVSSLNNPSNSEMNSHENMKLTCRKSS